MSLLIDWEALREKSHNQGPLRTAFDRPLTLRQ